MLYMSTNLTNPIILIHGLMLAIHRTVLGSLSKLAKLRQCVLSSCIIQ